MNVTTPQDPAKSTAYGYGPNVHQLASVTPPAGNSLGVRGVSFDGFGRLRTRSAPASSMTTTYSYDSLDRLRTETHSDQSPAVSYDYDLNGNLLHRSDASGTTTFGYASLNRLTSKAIPGGPTLTYGYDPAGNLTSVGGDGRSAPSTYHYDVANEVDQLSESSGRIDVFAYNPDHRRTDTWFAASYGDGGGVRYVPDGKTIAPPTFAAHTHVS
ncbi:MAG: RHS repeat protein, partial [Actinobacteria bacterium]|nr:RHS repeat protein [Actinomycetota bacterium]